MNQSETYQHNLQKYAELAVKVGINIQPGQMLRINARGVYEYAAPLINMIAAEAYKAGATYVDVSWTDEQLILQRLKHAPRDSFEAFPDWHIDALLQYAKSGSPVLSVDASTPNLLAGQDMELMSIMQRVSAAKGAEFRDIMMRNQIPWSILSVPNSGWAAKVFPDAPEEEQIPLLWDAIFKSCRIDLDDPVSAWRSHVRRLGQACAYLTGKQYKALRFKSADTDLEVGLTAGHLWKGGQSMTDKGQTFSPNLPTEEVFSMPHRDRVNGYVKSSKPLSLMGNLVDEFTLKFENGRVVSAEAKSGQDVLNKLLDLDEGARYLGEVALVSKKSPIAASGNLFYNTLFDENAATHIALGKAYAFNIEGGEIMTVEELKAEGANDSNTHVDFMIGSHDMSVDGVLADGSTEPVMRDGDWAIQLD